MATNNLTYKILLQMQDQATGAVRVVERELGQLGMTANQVQEAVNRMANDITSGMSRAANGAGNAAGGMANGAAGAATRFNGLAMSVQQVAREMPSLAISMNTFFLAISNNLPIMADQIKIARQENAVLVASGQKAIPVWKQVAGAFFSWQTAMVAGVTVLSLYGTKMASAIGDMIGLTNATNGARLAEEQLDSVRKKGVQSAQEEIARLNLLYRASTDVTRSMDDRMKAASALQSQWPDTFKNLSQESILVGNASYAYGRLKDSLIAVATAKAALDKITENASKRIDLEAQRDQLTERIRAAQQLESEYAKGGQAGGASMYAQASIQAARYRMQLENVEKQIQAIDTANGKLEHSIDIGSYADSIGKSNASVSVRSVVKSDNTDLSTLGGIENRIRSLKEAQLSASSEQAVALEKEILLWQNKLDLMRAAIGMAARENPVNPYLSPTGTAQLTTQNRMSDKYGVLVPIRIDDKQLKQMNQWGEAKLRVFQNKDAFRPFAEGIGAMASAMSGFTSVVGEAAGAWISWGSNLLSVVSQAVPAIAAMMGMTAADTVTTKVNTNAHFANAVSKTLSANAGMGPFGWIAGIAAVASVIAAMLSVPKLAGGTVASAPMLAMIGEYPGAGSNPEIVAPSSMIRKIIREEGTAMGGEVKFRIEGDALVGILSKTTRKLERTR